MKAAKNYLDGLNAAQRQAATYGSAGEGSVKAGPLLVIAGAGTGKTMTLAHRVAHLVVSGVDPERILLLTFTRRAAEEMRRRVETIVRRACGEVGGRGVRLPWAGTFHSIGNRLLRQFAANLGLDPAFSVLDRGDAADIMDKERHGLALTATRRRFPRKDTCLAIYSRTVNTGKALESVLDEAFPWCAEWEQELRSLFRNYVRHKQAKSLLDYDDLLLYWQHLVAEADFAKAIGDAFDHILVDEYQDTNRLQARVLLALKPDGSGVTVVGDDAQSIYAFRAAEVDNILSFPDHFEPKAGIVTLKQNYRSTQAILDTANRLIAGSKRQYEKELFASDRPGARPEYVTVEDGDNEAGFVVSRVLANRESGSDLKQQGVLFRSSHHSDRLELELIRRNIPYVKYGGLRFLEAAHVKDLLAVLKWADNPRNDIAAFRVLKLLPGVGPRLAQRCFRLFEAAGYQAAGLREFKAPAAASRDWDAFCDLFCLLTLAEDPDAAWQSGLAAARVWYRTQLERLYESPEIRDADLEQLERIAGRYATRERFLTELTLDPPARSGDLARDPALDEDYLVLSTIHSAKGQEWNHVFVLNVTDGNFPSEFAAGKPEQIEEERRLLYVAMTRARESLALIAPLRFHVTAQHPAGDRHVYGARSRFLTGELMATLEARFFSRESGGEVRFPGRPERQIDIAGRLLDQW